MVDPIIQLALAGLVAATGSFILWKYYGKKIVATAVIKFAGTAFWNKIDEMFENPEGESSKKFGKLTGLGMAYILQGLTEMIQTEEGRERLKPLMFTLFQSIQGMIFGTYGQILQKLKSEGENIQIPSNGGGFLPNLPPQVLGMAQKLFPNVDINDAIGLINWLSRFRQIGIGGSHGFSSPDRSAGILKGEK